jgi:hypothetical protein
MRLFFHTILYALNFLAVPYLLSHISNCQAEAHLTARVEPDEGTIDTTFYFELNVLIHNQSTISNPQIEPSKYFSIEMISSSMQQHQVNNDIKSRKTIVFKLIPKGKLRSGQYTTPKGRIYIDTSWHELPREKFIIRAPIQESPQSKNPFAGKKGATIPKDMDEFSFVQIVSNENPYVGEQVSYRLELITPANLKEAKLHDFNPQGVWRERFENDGKSARVVQNVTIHSFSESWFPIQSGTFEIPYRELVARLQIIERRRAPPQGSLSEQLFGGLFPFMTYHQTVEKTITSNPLEIKIRPLPPPPSDAGSYIPVGSLKINSSIDKKKAAVGDSVTLTVQVSGNANLRPFNLPSPLNYKKNIFRKYDEKPILNKSITNGEVIFFKTFKISLVPQAPGIHTVPSFKITWFNPQKGSYQDTTTAVHIVEIKGEPLEVIMEEVSSEALEESTDSLTLPLGKDSLYKTYGRRISFASPFLVFYLSLASIGIMFLLFIASIFRIQLQNVFSGLLKRKRIQLSASIIANKKYTMLEADSLLRAHIAAWLNIPAQSLTAKEIKSELNEKFPAAKTIDAIYTFLKNSEITRYSGETDTTVMGQKLREILSHIERLS